ncbi:MAG: hypothetical protein WBI59_05730 [Limnochordia bacterium]
MKHKYALAVVLVLLVTLSGCFGGKQEERILAQLDLSAEKESIAQGGSNTITVIGKDAKNRTMTVKPEADAWSFEPAEAGTLAPAPNDQTSVVFTAAEDWTGTVTVKIEFEGFSAETTFEVSPIVITGVWAYRDIKAQDGSYKDDPNVHQNHANGARQAPEDTPGFARCYSHGAVFIDWLYGGHWISWDIDVPAAGEYVLVVRYSCPVEDVNQRRRTLTIDGEEIVTFEYAKTDSNKWGNEPQHWSFVVVPGITIDEAKTIELKLTHTAPPGKGESTALAYLALVSPPNVEIDEEFLVEIEQVLGIERDLSKDWNPQQ